MDANGGFHQEFNSNNPILLEMNNNNNNVVENIINNDKRNSIANRRAENCGFNVSSLHPCGSSQNTEFIFSVSPGISPSELLDSSIDSPVMLTNVQFLPSPTTGRCSPSPDYESFGRKINGDNNTIGMGIIFSSSGDKDYSECLQEDTLIAKTEECEVECLAPNCKNNNRNQEQKQQQQQCWEDGFLWRKYGQKQVKGSEFPRSYYKCTSTNCDVTKKVERSLDGQISEIVYKGSHNHPPVREVNFDEMPEMNIINEHTELGAPVKDEDFALLPDSMHPSPPPPVFDQQLDQVSPQSISNEGEDDHINGQCDPKRRKIRESSTAGPSHETNATARSGREPKVVFQLVSEVDILEDGYRWRKYGQKVVKGNPNPRSYYKCTTPHCFVRKHVERAANDIKSVVTTYEGKHNHVVPTSRTNNSTSATISTNATLPTNPTLPSPSTISMPIPMSMSMPMPMSIPTDDNRVQEQLQNLPGKKPVMNYDEFLTSNLATTFGFPIYPYSFHSLPTYSGTSFINHTNIPMNNYPDCMSSSNVCDLDPKFHYVPPMRPVNQGQEIKEDQNVYDHIFLSLPDHEN